MNRIHHIRRAGRILAGLAGALVALGARHNPDAYWHVELE